MKTHPMRTCAIMLPLLAILLIAPACVGTRAAQMGEGSSSAAAQGLGPDRYYLPLVSGNPHCAVAQDTVLAEGAIGPSWIPWDSPCLPNADLVYVRPDTWDLWVMDEHGGHQRCLTCYGDNVLGVNFPLDEDGRPPTVHWKGGPEVHPTAPIIILKAENENSPHNALRNSPNLGWDNDLWALNVCTRRYTRLTQLAPDQGTQHTGISNDGRWFAYPLRYQYGDPLRNFGLARLVIAKLSVDGAGDAHLQTSSEEEPNGPMYYEPSDIQSSTSGSWTLLYAAGDDMRLDPYSYTWSCQGEQCTGVNRHLLTTPQRHEELAKFSPSAERVAWMAGPSVGFVYDADLYLSRPDFTAAERMTWYNDCQRWPAQCKRSGAQLSRLDWKGDGTALFFGLWIHANVTQSAASSELHRLEFVGRCG